MRTKYNVYDVILLEVYLNTSLTLTTSFYISQYFSYINDVILLEVYLNTSLTLTTSFY